MANVHCAAATENFLVLENHSVEVPWWGDLVDGVEKPIVNVDLLKCRRNRAWASLSRRSHEATSV